MKFTKDMFERLAATAVQAFLSVFVICDVATTEAALVAAGAAVLAALKAMLAKSYGTTGTASLVD